MNIKVMQKSKPRCEEDNFRDVFKYYKRKQPPPDLSGVLVVEAMEEAKGIIKPNDIFEKDRIAAEEVGLKPQSSWAVYILHQHPGLLIIRNPFTSKGQLKWMKRCLQDYPCAENPSNLSSHGIKLSNETWWELSQMSEGKKEGLSKKLRWVTLGYHHNWDTKEYSEDMRGIIPHSLDLLCSVVAKALGFPYFRAEAAIVNYYHLDSTLAAHTDHSEPCVTAPLFSFSFGQSAIFLIGGVTKATRPTALYLHSGDILVMSGPSRLNYHAVPRIVQTREQPWEEASIQRRIAKGQGESEFKVKVRMGEQTELFGSGSVTKGQKEAGCNTEVRVQEEQTDVLRKGNEEFRMNLPDNNVRRQEQIDKDYKKQEGNNDNEIISDACNNNYSQSHQKNIFYSEFDQKSTQFNYNSKGSQDILDYMKFSRINVNVRQVLESSADKLPS